MTPLFSATKTRPSGENRIAVGFVNPLKTVTSWKFEGRDPAMRVPASALPAFASRRNVRGLGPAATAAWTGIIVSVTALITSEIASAVLRRRPDRTMVDASPDPWMRVP